MGTLPCATVASGPGLVQRYSKPVPDGTFSIQISTSRLLTPDSSWTWRTSERLPSVFTILLLATVVKMAAWPSQLLNFAWSFAGAISGRALYDGRIEVAAAMALLKEPASC